MLLPRVVLALAGVAAAAPELVSVLEAFDGPADAVDVFGPPGPFSPGTLGLASAADGTLRLTYDYKAPAAGPAGIFIEKFSPNGSTFTCAGATHILLKYRVLNASTLPGSVHLRIGVQTKIDEDAGPPARRLQPSGDGPPSDGEPLAFFLWGNGFVLDDDATGEWQELLVELCSGGSRAVDPFVDIGRTGTILDAGDIRRWRIGVGMHGAPGQTAQGAFLVDELSCVRDPAYARAPGNCTAAPGACSEVGPVRFDITSPRARNDGYKPRQCCEACAADPTCVYWTTDATLNPPMRFPSCYFFDELRPEDVVPAGADAGGEARADPLASGWVSDESSRGLMCDVCTCAVGGAVTCSGNLSAVPAAPSDGYVVKWLDLSETTLAVVVGLPPTLEALVLPRDAIYQEVPEHVELLVDGEAPEFCNDVCMTFHAVGPNASYCTTEEKALGFDSTYYASCTGVGDPIVLDATTVMAEAAESPELCAHYCSLIQDCVAFDHDARPPEERPGFAFTDEPTCFLYEAVESCTNDDPSDGLTWGISPRARHAAGASVDVVGSGHDHMHGHTGSQDSMASEIADGKWRYDYELRLGAAPAMGAVWVTPRADGVVFSPARVALYDTTPVAVTATVADPPEQFTVIIEHDVESCDSAFLESSPSLTFGANHPSGGSKKNNREAKRLRKVFIIAAGMLGCLLFLAAVAWAARRIYKYVKRAEALAEERAQRVEDQVEEAKRSVADFQAPFYTVAGDRFLKFEYLEPHEVLADSGALPSFLTTRRVREAQNSEGLVFVFISHQWLGWDHPDPEGVQVVAMKNAVRFAAEEAGVPPSSLRIWLDMVSIPQTNPAVQKQVIASLPVFASVVDMFIVVAPNCRHTHTMNNCDAASYRARGWCRAEMFSCWARNGHSSMFYATNRGLEKLARSDEGLVTALDTFGGQFTCCARGHDDGGSCDREALMLPLLGIWAEVYRGRKDARRKAYKALAPRLDELFPATAKFTVADGEPEERVLFGDLVDTCVEITSSRVASMAWRSTNAP